MTLFFRVDKRHSVEHGRVDLGYEKKFSLSSKYFLVIFCMIVSMAIGVDAVFAEDGGSVDIGGGGSQSGAANCGDNALDNPCPPGTRLQDYNWAGGDGKYGGGASWRIFKTDDASGLDDYTGYGNNILTESKKATAISECSAIGAKWIVSFGWDGMTGSHYGYDNYNFQIGPAKRVEGEDAIFSAKYNNYGLTSVINADGSIKSSAFRNNIKISEADALALYQISKNYPFTAIPPETGAFCSFGESKSFEGLAAVSKGPWNEAASADKKSTDWTATSKSASTLSMKCPNGGCNDAKFFLKLKTKTGSGETQYRRGGTGISWKPSSSTFYDLKPSSGSSGTSVLNRTDGSEGVYVTIKPGVTHCRYLKFKPYGTYSSDTVSTLSACAFAEVTTFTGSVSVSGAVTGGTGEGSGNASEVLPVNCPVGGCKVKFTRTIKSSKNLGSTNYSVVRTSNLSSKVSGGTQVNNKTFTATLGGASESTDSGDLTLYPGMKVCEKIDFNKDNNSKTETGNAVREVCVLATGNAQASTLLNIKVKNSDVAEYNSYRTDTIYAKPEDKLEYIASYNPELQYSYYLEPDFMQIGNGSIISNSGKTLGDLFDSKRDNNKKWNNGFGIIARRDDNLIKGWSYTYSPGATGVVEKTGSYSVDSNDVGHEIKRQAKTNYWSSSLNMENNETTPGQVSFSYSGGKFISKVSTDSVGNDTVVKVPYNFTTGIKIELKGDTNIDGVKAFGAGESGSANVNVEVKPKANSLTANDGEEYATKADTKVRLIVFVPRDSANIPEARSDYGNYNSNLCNYYNSDRCYSMTAENEIEKTFDGITTKEAKELKESGKTGKEQELTPGGTTFNVPDFKAGTKVCVAAAVWPSTSGDPDNLRSSGDDKWNISKAECFVVYKKPSIQIWGGEVFSAGELKTPVASKNNIAGSSEQGYEYDIREKGKVTIFGSFGELGVKSVGTVSGFSSGAATGYGANNGNGTLTPLLSGSSSGRQSPLGGYTGGSSFCERSRLTFANTNSKDELSCTFDAPGLNASGESSANSDRISLVSTFINMSEEEAGSDGVIVKRVAGDYKISEDGDAFSFVEKGFTKVVYAKEGNTAWNVTIDKDIKYDDGYTDLKDVPKMIIYANNINIDCNVDRIDAVLIAENDIDTCYNSTGVNSPENSRQLVINGTVIANKLKANRTYGAATGSNSIVPAEIIDYDTTLYLWGSKKADVSESGKLDTVYKRQLAPRR